MAVSNVNSSAQIHTAHNSPPPLTPIATGRSPSTSSGLPEEAAPNLDKSQHDGQGRRDGVDLPLSEPPLGFEPIFQGFDARAGCARGSLTTRNVLMNYDPRDPTAMKRAFVVSTASPHLRARSYDNLMLTGTADYMARRSIATRTGRIAIRIGHGPGSVTTPHPGPNGEIT
jgi:hypothetical protein